jgi:hypothetical protein
MATTRHGIERRKTAFLLSGLVLLLFAFGMVARAAADPMPQVYENWKTDFEKRSIPFGEVLSGGPPKDGIPAIDDPKFVSIDEAGIADLEPVIGFEHKGEAKAYPLSVLMWHEIANDIVGGDPFAITYCPLCNAAIVFDAMIDGKAHDFGTTGRLRNSDLLMYDRQSESWWQQFSGEAVIGKFTGRTLHIMPSRLESFASFKQRFPLGKVLVPNNPGARQYGRNPYLEYDSRSAPYPLYQGDLPDNIEPMARVIVLRRDGKAVAAVALDKVREAGTLQIDGFDLNWSAGQASALDTAQIAEGRDVGNLVVTEMVDGASRDGVHDMTFAFVVHAFHPHLEIRQ